MSERAVDFVPSPAQSLLDLTAEALCHVDPDGTIHPANATMRELLAAFTEQLQRPIARLTDLPLEDEDREALTLLLASSEPWHECVVRLTSGHRRRSRRAEEEREDEGERDDGPRAAGTRLVRVRLRRSAAREGYVMALRDETLQRMIELRALRLERLRLLGTLTTGLVHDVSKLLDAVFGYASHLATVASDPDEKAFLDNVRRDARQGAMLVHKVEQLVRAPARQRRKVRFQQLVTEAMQMFTRSASLDGIELSVEMDEDLPAVRVVPGDVIQAMLHLLVWVRGSLRRGTPLRVHARQERRPAARPDLAARHEAVLCIVDLGDFAEMAALRALLRHPEDGLLEQMGKLGGDCTGLLLALLSLASTGGRIECHGPQQGRRVFELRLPAVRSGAGEREGE